MNSTCEAAAAPLHPSTPAPPYAASMLPMHPSTHAPLQVGSWILTYMTNPNPDPDPNPDPNPNANQVGSWLLTYMTGSFLAAFSLGCFASWLGAFGHNWVHQPRYKLWAYLSLDTVGFSSDGWYREHLLQHHMYTNTPWDNHFLGTDPFLVVDPTVPRAWWQTSITPFINPLLLTFGLYANYTAHLIETFKGHESWRPTKALLPLQARTAPRPTLPQRCAPSASAPLPPLPPFCPPSPPLRHPLRHPLRPCCRRRSG